MKHFNIRRWLTSLGVATARPWAFVIVGVYAVIWLITDSQSFDFHAFATLATLFMTLLIQRAEHRDAQAMHAKLDELLHTHTNARNDMTRIDEQEPEEIEKHRSYARRNDGTT